MFNTVKFKNTKNSSFDNFIKDFAIWAKMTEIERKREIESRQLLYKK